MKCSWFNCNKEATVKIVNMNEGNCDEHWEINLLRFGCPDMFESLPEPPEEQKYENQKIE